MNRWQRRHGNQQRNKKLFPDDKGELQVVMATKDDKVVIEFSDQLLWFAMGVPEAKEFVEKLNKHIAELEAKQ